MITRNVNGKTVVLTPEEETALLAEWAANDPALIQKPPAQPTLQDVINVLSPDQKTAIALAVSSKLPTP